jgi:hypothetical protein
MMTDDTKKYEEWLTTIANTRLIYNTMDELETTLDNHSIHSNGIKRCFTSPQKMRAVFRDLMVETSLMTNYGVDLRSLLESYKETWTFYSDNFMRRTNSRKIVFDMLRCVMPPYCTDGIGKKMSALFEEIIERNLSVPLLMLMLMKVIPGYDSKGGDAADIPVQYEEVMKLLEEFVADAPGINVKPAIDMAREEKHKSRLMLIYHVNRIFNTYEEAADPRNQYELADAAKDSSVSLSLGKYWNECGGKPLSTDFWTFEPYSDDNSYRATHWHKDGNNKLTGIRFTLFFYEHVDGRLIAYLIHPKAVTHFMKGEHTEDEDNMWYVTEMPHDDAPDRLQLERMMQSKAWHLQIDLTMVTDDNVIECYEGWFKTCRIEMPFKELEYVFHPGIYAVTHQHIYIPVWNGSGYYKVPRTIHEGMTRITLNDKAGTMEMGGRTYLVFDELFLFIDTNMSELNKYGIEIVTHID